jgi:hypothetical protein
VLNYAWLLAPAAVCNNPRRLFLISSFGSSTFAHSTEEFESC